MHQSRYPADNLREFAFQSLRWAGAGVEDADLAAEGLVAADLRGVHSHGVIRSGVYVSRIRHGSINTRASLHLIRDSGPVVLADAEAGLGIPAAAKSMDVAIERARVHGVGVVGVRNSNHCGMLAWPAMRALPHSMIGIVMSNADAKVAPWGAKVPYLGTNPIAIAIPAAQEPPIVLDMATSVVAHGRLAAAAVGGESIPAGWALDADGRVTFDPQRALEGALLPFGGAKGSGLALVIDVLAGILTGAMSSPMVTPLYESLQRAQGLGQFFIALSVQAFTDPVEFASRVDGLIRDIRSLPPAEGHSRVYLPGEIEHQRTADYLAHGIPLPANVVEEVHRLAAEIGIAPPHQVSGNLSAQVPERGRP